MDLDDILKTEVISGGISGAILDADAPEAMVHAYKYYDFIRKSNTDVSNIAKNTGFTEGQISLIKNYIFYDEHELIGGKKRFEPDFYMAQSWKRLAFEANNIKLHDIMLIRHELYELVLVAQGFSYQEAHQKANDEGFNYQQMCKEYYQELEMKQTKKNHENKEIYEEMFSIEKDDNDDFER